MTAKRSKTPIAILGAGLAGLSTAFHLKKGSYVVLEKEKEVGGTARSFKIKNFTFDFTGHLLHLHTPYTKKLITKLLKNQFYSCVRKAQIFSHGVYTRYPFQANTFGLPDNVIDECVLGVLEAQLKKNPKKPFLQFSRWCIETFGKGISKYFMLPYNEKLYQVRASRLTTEWCGPFVPTPNLDEVINGALAEQKKGFGYNTTFLYPKNGGIQTLAQSLAQGLSDIYLNEKIKTVDWKKKRIISSDGRSLNYNHLVNTIPLMELLNLMRPLPSSIEQERKKLKFASILCLNIGINRKNISDSSWVYFPEKKYVFYRVGFPMNFTPHVVPKNCSSMYVEIPFKNVRSLSNSEIVEKVKRGLNDAKILRLSDKLLVCQFLPIRYAYVIYDKNRTPALLKINAFLKDHNIQSIGRYGGWKYSFMEEAILDGKRAAENIRGTFN